MADVLQIHIQVLNKTPSVPKFWLLPSAKKWVGKLFVLRPARARLRKTRKSGVKSIKLIPFTRKVGVKSPDLILFTRSDVVFSRDSRLFNRKLRLNNPFRRGLIPVI